MSEYEIQVGSLEELALKRRERLKNLKRKAQTDTATPTEHQPDEPTKTRLPRATQLLESQEAENGAGDDAAMEVVRVQDNDVVTTMTNEIDVMKKPLIIEEIDIQNLAPRKPDWDLKRGKFPFNHRIAVFSGCEKANIM